MRRLFSLVALSSVAAAMALAAVPRPAAAAVETLTNFNLTVVGQPVSGDTLQLFIKPSPAAGQVLLFCAPNVPPRPQTAILPCQGGGKVYDIGLSAPAGLKESFRFERVAADGTITVLMQGTFTTREGGPLASQQQTFNATITYTAGTMPNTAVAAAAPRADASEAVLPALGIFMVLIAAAMSARRRRSGTAATISAE